MSRHFDAELIEQIKDANDIVSVISEHMTLKKKGRNYWGCCPFHNEKTPSFSVNPEKGFFYCFGCHESGNAIGFLMKYDGLSFPEALERLANRAGIALPQRFNQRRITSAGTQGKFVQGECLGGYIFS